MRASTTVQALCSTRALAHCLHWVRTVHPTSQLAKQRAFGALKQQLCVINKVFFFSLCDVQERFSCLTPLNLTAYGPQMNGAFSCVGITRLEIWHCFCGYRSKPAPCNWDGNGCRYCVARGCIIFKAHCVLIYHGWKSPWCLLGLSRVMCLCYDSKSNEDFLGWGLTESSFLLSSFFSFLCFPFCYFLFPSPRIG